MNNKRKDNTPFNMSEKPCKQSIFLLPLIWISSYFLTRSNHLKIKKIGMKCLKPPFIVLSQHQGFMDYYLSPLSVFPYRANYVSDVEGFATYGKFLYKRIGCLAKRRFSSDISLIRNIQHVTEKNRNIIFIYPEARHSNVGTNSKIPSSTGKLIKLLNIPVVVQKIYGSYLSIPFWDEKHKRKAPIRVVLEKVLDSHEIKRISAEEINEIIERHFQYDEYRWQYENKIRITYPKRAEGLHKVLYMCPNCKKEYYMTSQDASLRCKYCHKSWNMDEYGRLTSNEGKTEFSHIPDWYEFQRNEVKKQIESARYFLKAEVSIDILPNEKGFISLGYGILEHTLEGFRLNFLETNETMEFLSSSMISVQTEYDYKGRGQCIVLSTNNCCYYVYPRVTDFNVTKIQFAAEEFHCLKSQDRKK